MLRQALLIVGAASIAACSSNPGPTDGFEPTHVAKLVVTARTSTGMPLDSVGITAVPLSDRLGDFGTMTVMADAQGRSELSVERFTARVSASQTDTVRFVVTAQALKRAFLDGNNGQPVIKKDTLLLTFRPYGQAPSVDSIVFAFGPP